MNKQLFQRLAVIGAAASTGIANAAVDTTGVTTSMTDAGAAIAIVGGAYLVVKVGIKVWPWVAAAMGR